MLKSIYVRYETHPELYAPELNLGLDITADVVDVDKERKMICRLPATNSTHVVFAGTNSNLQYIFDEIEVN